MRNLLKHSRRCLTAILLDTAPSFLGSKVSVRKYFRPRPSATRRICALAVLALRGPQYEQHHEPQLTRRKTLRPVLGSKPATHMRPQYLPRPTGRTSSGRRALLRLFVNESSEESAAPPAATMHAAPRAERSGASPPNPQEGF